MSSTPKITIVVNKTLITKKKAAVEACKKRYKAKTRAAIQKAQPENVENVPVKRNGWDQRLLKKVTILNYGSKKCAVTGVEDPIELCHIVPFVERPKFDMWNVLLFRSDIHKLFDSYKISINPDTLRVEILDDNKDYKTYNNKQIEIPSHMLEDGVRKNLKVHYERFMNTRDSSRTIS